MHCFIPRIIFLAAAILGTVMSGCSSEQARDHIVQGWTMGTYYRVTMAGVTSSQAKQAEKKILQVLDTINKSMSVFDPQSEVSRFNQLEPGRPFCPSPDFARTMSMSLKVYEMTGGVFDPTLGSVIDLWGFGPEPSDMTVPDQALINEAMAGVGLDKIIVDEKGCMSRTHPDTKLNLSGIAKGYAVDSIAAALEMHNIHSFLVDIGGDLYAGDPRPDGSAWRVGINVPTPQAGLEDIMEILEISNAAVATSGDYRNYITIDGQRYSHIIDPATGYPVQRGIVSATVKAGSCALADALATAMLIMDKDDSLELAEESGLFQVQLIVMDESQVMSVYASPGLQN